MLDITTLTGTSYSISSMGITTISDLKGKIAEESGYAAQQQNLTSLIRGPLEDHMGLEGETDFGLSLNHYPEIPDNHTLRRLISILKREPGKMVDTYGPIEGWRLGSQVKDLSHLFEGQDWTYEDSETGQWVKGGFQGDISGWDVSRIENMDSMFKDNPDFQGDLSGWDVSSVKNMNSMFMGAHRFNSRIGGWDVSQVATAMAMFYDTKGFSQDLSQWQFDNLRCATLMFAYFNPNYPYSFSNWNMDPRCNTANMFVGWSKKEMENLLPNHIVVV